VVDAGRATTSLKYAGSFMFTYTGKKDGAAKSKSFRRPATLSGKMHNPHLSATAGRIFRQRPGVIRAAPWRRRDRIFLPRRPRHRQGLGLYQGREPERHRTDGEV
jgi:hypothetical protein